MDNSQKHWLEEQVEMTDAICRDLSQGKSTQLVFQIRPPQVKLDGFYKLLREYLRLEDGGDFTVIDKGNRVVLQPLQPQPNPTAQP